jgi:hypothetical protein
MYFGDDSVHFLEMPKAMSKCSFASQLHAFGVESRKCKTWVLWPSWKNGNPIEWFPLIRHDEYLGCILVRPHILLDIA